MRIQIPAGKRIIPVLRLSIVALSTVAAFGQATDGNIEGAVTDPAGAVIAGAQVTATNTATNVKYETVSSAAGEYRLNNVPVGRYDVSATAQGFAAAKTSDVDVELNRTTPVNLSLMVGNVTEQVTVTEAAASIDTTTSQLQTTWNADAAQNLPLAGISRETNGAGIYNISLGNAGVAMAGGVGYGVGPSVAGQRSDNNSFSIDGVNNDNRNITGPLVYVSNEVISEFTVLQNQFSPEFGGASGGLFNVIVKSGTNQLHGSIFEYLQNRNLDAVDNSLVLAGNRTNPRLDNNRFGATVGGPIVKDKLFYFGSYEYNPVGQASVPGATVYAPTQAGLNLLNSMTNLSKTNLSVFEKYVPVAATADPNNPITVNGVNIPDGPLTFASPNYTNSYHAIASVDYDLSLSDRLRGRYIYDKNDAIDNNADLPVFYQMAPTLNQAVSLSEFHNFSPTMTNEIRISYSRRYGVTPVGDFTFPGLNAFPNLSFDELNLQLGPDPNAPSGAIQNQFEIQENLTKTWGKHTFKAGYNLSDLILSSYFIQRVRGDYDYATLQQFLLDQQPSGGDISGVLGERSFSASGQPLTGGVPEGFLQHSAFFNDDYRVRKNLTLNLGLRYEIVTVPVASRAQSYSAIADVPGVLSFNQPGYSKNDWSPRIGFAYSPGNSGKWAIRGGVGRSFDLPYANLSTNANPPYYQVTEDVNSANPVNNFLANGGLTYTPQPVSAASARASISSYTWYQNRPYALNGTLGVQRLLGNDYTLEARYVYTKGVHLYVQDRLNVVPEVTPNNYIPTFFTMPSAAQFASLTKTLGTPTTPGSVEGTLPPGTTSQEPWNDLAVYGFDQAVVGFNPVGNSRYNGLALQLTKRYSKNFQYLVAYTWSHNEDDSTATLFSTYFTPRRGQDFQNQGADWADSALDHRQRLTITPMYDVRIFQRSNWLMRNIVGNWNISGTYTYQTGERATVQSGVDSNLNNDSAGDRTIINPNGAATAGTGVTGYNSAGQAVAAGSPSIVAYVANSPNARYVVAGLGALANAGRNTLLMPAINNFDVSLLKRFNFTERMRLELGGQFVNLFNHPQYIGSWINDVGTNPGLGASLGRNELIPSNPLFAQWSQFFNSNSRVIQVVGRFIF
jgi:Carboxypeptidase regulatory-like domain